MTNKERFLALVSDEKTDTLERNRERIKNRAMLRESQQIALKVLMRLDELGWSQKELATKMEVSPQQITKIVSGKENLTIETQIKLQNILDIPVLASYYESRISKIGERLIFIEKQVEKIAIRTERLGKHYQSAKIVTIKANDYSQIYSQYLAV